MIDPTCALHGMKWSEHEYGKCLYCCLCFKTLTLETCHTLPDGTKEDVCDECAEQEEIQARILTVEEARSKGFPYNVFDMDEEDMKELDKFLDKS